MEHLSNALRALFAEQDGDNVLYKAGLLKKNDKYTSDECINLDTELQESHVMGLLKKTNVYNTLDQQAIVGQVIMSQWMKPNCDCKELKFFDDSIYNVLLHFGCKTLFLKDNEPTCHYSRLLRWHLTTSLLGEDLFTTSYVAAYDINNSLQRKYFDWPAFIEHNNKELNAVLSRPIADLHMHLKGSSYNFDLSWLSVVNNIDRMVKKFDDVYQKRKIDEWDPEFYYKMYRASVIRLYLASRTGLISKEVTCSQLMSLLNPLSMKEMEMLKGKFEKNDYELPTFRSIIKAIKIRNNDDSNISPYQNVDYIKIAHYTKETINSILASERELMYRVFCLIMTECNDYQTISTLFYAYLSYKSTFRQSIVQLNSAVGFHNFSEYEGLKDSFIEDDYKKYLYQAAIEPFLRNGRERYLETRIVPADTSEKISHKIKEIYDCIQEGEMKTQFNIIFHFIKKRDNREEKRYRHFLIREEIKQQAFAIYNFRNDERNWGENPLAGCVVGIDAANSEIYCRPEVFAPAFRFLRNHKIINGFEQRPNDLNITFHVGEDFFDVADGLRAVEEAMIFLNLRNGDRLGHCLALGTDVRKYYEMRYHTICSTKQVLLDNMAWLHHKCKKLVGYTPLCYYLESTFHDLFLEIFGDEKYKDGKFNYDRVFDAEDNLKAMNNIQDYYLSWLLRGNSPTFASDESIVPTSDIEKEWLNVSVNHHLGAELARNNNNALEIHEQYHNDRVVNKGSDAKTFTIREEYRDDFYSLIETIQEHLLCKIEKKRISIECNPSSNYKIGEMMRYDGHPITKFFNRGLSTPYSSHDIAVSINTDDQGVFSTSLEREYSLIALAMERYQPEGYKNSPRQIIEWLDKIREMSVEQQFSNIKNKM